MTTEFADLSEVFEVYPHLKKLFEDTLEGYHLRSWLVRGKLFLLAYGYIREGEFLIVYDVETGKNLCDDFGGKYATYRLGEIADKLVSGEEVHFQSSGDERLGGVIPGKIITVSPEYWIKKEAG